MDTRGANLFAEKTSLHRKVFMVFSDLSILVALKNRAMTAYGINNHFISKIGEAASPSTVYNKLAELEREGLIICVRDRQGRAYGLTDKGRRIANNAEANSEEVKRFLDKLLKP